MKASEKIKREIKNLGLETHEFRTEWTHETGLPSPYYSRHYECKEVAVQLSDGSWVGFTYWFGGGKHGDPGSIDWIEDAYNLEVTEVMKPVLEFKKVDDE